MPPMSNQDLGNGLTHSFTAAVKIPWLWKRRRGSITTRSIQFPRQTLLGNSAKETKVKIHERTHR
jgi:hypothetical protein